MVTRVDPISMPPTPADTPAVFEERASQVWADLYKAVPQMNLQAAEVNVFATAASQAAGRAQTDSDFALGYKNEAKASKETAVVANAQAQEAKAAAATAKQDAENARDAAQASAQGMGQAIAMAASFASVPATFQAWQIVVTVPHMRLMVWNGTNYIRAPWHQPGVLMFSYADAMPGTLPVRADVSYQQADYPDLAAYLGLSGSGTFTLVEARGEFLRVLDNGRGVDAGRVIRSAQSDAIKHHKHSIDYNGLSTANGYSAIKLTQDIEGVNGLTGFGGDGPETRGRNIAFPLRVTY